MLLVCMCPCACLILLEARGKVEGALSNDHTMCAHTHVHPYACLVFPFCICSNDHTVRTKGKGFDFLKSRRVHGGEKKLHIWDVRLRLICIFCFLLINRKMQISLPHNSGPHIFSCAVSALVDTG